MTYSEPVPEEEGTRKRDEVGDGNKGKMVSGIPKQPFYCGEETETNQRAVLVMIPQWPVETLSPLSVMAE